MESTPHPKLSIHESKPNKEYFVQGITDNGVCLEEIIFAPDNARANYLFIQLYPMANFDNVKSRVIKKKIEAN